MTRILCWLVALWVVASLSACGSASTVPPIPPGTTSLSLEEWKQLPPAMEKYEVGTLDLLRASDPELKSEKKWKLFMEKEVGPQMKLDMPEQFK